MPQRNAHRVILLFVIVLHLSAYFVYAIPAADRDLDVFDDEVAEVRTRRRPTEPTTSTRKPTTPTESNFDELSKLLSSSDAVASVRLVDFLKLWDATHRPTQTTPTPTPTVEPVPYPYVILSTSINGSLTTAHSAFAEITFKVEAFNDGWMEVPLLGHSSNIISSWDVQTVTSSRSALSPPLSTSSSLSSHEPRLILDQDKSLVLLSPRAAIYTITVRVSAPVSNPTKQQSSISFYLSSGHHSIRNSLRFELPLANAYVTINPTVPVEREKTAGKDATIISALFPPTNELSIEWVAQELSEVSTDNQIPTTLRAQQKVYHDITNDLYCLSSVYIEYNIAFGQQSKFQVELDPRVRIVDVEGPSITRWDIATVSDENDEKKHLLNVFLEHPVDSSFKLRIMSEMELGLDLSKGVNMVDVALPAFSSVGVRRETCTMGISAGTFLQVAEKRRDSSLTRIDVREFTDTIDFLLARPIVWAYTSTSANYQLTVSVTKHDDVGVLPAIVDSALYELTLIEDRVLYYMTYKIRNSQKQYLRVDVTNSNYQVWSTFLANEPVKPSSDAGSLLIPLRKDLGDDESSTYEVQLIYFAPFDQRLGSKGNITLPLPIIDVPIADLKVHTYMPVNYTYTFDYSQPDDDADIDQDTTVKQNNQFAHEERLREIRCSTGTSTPDREGRRGKEEHHKYFAERREAKNMAESWDFPSRQSAQAPQQQQHQQYKYMTGQADELEGVIPVRVSPMHTGNQRCFGQLLLREKAIAVVRATYERDNLNACKSDDLRFVCLLQRYVYPQSFLFAPVCIVSLVCACVYCARMLRTKHSKDA